MLHQAASIRVMHPRANHTEPYRARRRGRERQRAYVSFDSHSLPLGLEAGSRLERSTQHNRRTCELTKLVRDGGLASDPILRGCVLEAGCIHSMELEVVVVHYRGTGGAEGGSWRGLGTGGLELWIARATRACCRPIFAEGDRGGEAWCGPPWILEVEAPPARE